MKFDTDLKITDLTTAWGLVRLFSQGGTLARKYKITSVEADAFCSQPNGYPPGMLENERGLVFEVTTRPCDIGECVINTDGSLAGNFGVEEKAGRVIIDAILIAPGAWEFVGGVVRAEEIYSAPINSKLRPG